MTARVLWMILVVSVAAGERALGQTTGPLRVSPDPGVDHRDYRVGERIENTSVTSIDGRVQPLADLLGAKATVIAIRDAGCPLSKKYAPRLKSLEDQYGSRGVRFVFLNPGHVDSLNDMDGDRERYGFEGTYLNGSAGNLADLLLANRTTDVFVLDRAFTLRYRGAIDDQYGIGYTNAAPSRDFLVDAIEAVLNDREVDVPATIAPGCVLNDSDGGPQPWAADAITYHDQIERIVQANCMVCHRDGGPAPFVLQTYEQVRGRAKMIDYVIDNHLMPPWHANGGLHEFANDRSLSDREKNAMRSWVANGMPEGDSELAPVAIEWPTSGWQIGEPDAVFAIPQAYRVPAEGALDYRYTYVKTNFEDDRWISAMEIRPTHPEVVHHVLVFLEEPQQEGESRRDVRRRWQGGLRGYFAGLVPGQATTVYPDGVAKRLPAGAWLKFQIHYTPNGSACEDQTEIAFIFSDEPPAQEIRTASAMETDFRIPPRDGNYQVVAWQTFSRPGTIYSFAPHMHLRGKAFRYELFYPDGRHEVVLDIPQYDFNWQTRYKLRHPIEVPTGTRLKATAWFDNSTANPANPDPSRIVTFGEQTWDEMMIGYFEYWRREDS